MDKETAVAFLVAFIVLIMIETVSASDLFPANKGIDYKKPCINNGTYCSPSAECNMTVIHPNSSLILNNVKMTNQISFHNYTIPAQSSSGTYTVNMVCTDNGKSGAETLYFQINPSGEEIDGSITAFYLGLLALIFVLFGISIYFFTTTSNLLIRVGSFGMAYILLTAVSFIGYNMAQNYLADSTAIVGVLRTIFFVLMIGALPMLLGAFSYYVIMLFKIKEIERLMEKGIPYDESVRRAERK